MERTHIILALYYIDFTFVKLGIFQIAQLLDTNQNCKSDFT